MEMIVRLANSQDIEGILELDRRCSDGNSFYDASTWEDSVHDKEILIALAQGKVIGVICIDEIDARYSFIADFIIDPDLRGQGYGKKLLESALAIADTRNTLQLLHVGEENYTAIKLYEQFGFSALPEPGFPDFFDIEMKRPPHFYKNLSL